MKPKRICNEVFEKSSEELAKFLLGKIICYKTKSQECFRWRIIETEAYSTNNGGDTKCRKKEEYKSVGKLIFDGGNGINISCTNSSCCDNVLIRGAVTAFDSQPEKFMKAFSFKECSIEESVLDLTDETCNVCIEDDGYKVDLESLEGNTRKNAEGPNWNYKICFSCDLLEGLNK